MSGVANPITGRCLCGAVVYRADAEPVFQAVCHCADCQRQTGGPFTVVVGVPRAAFEVQGSTLATFATTGEDHGGETQRSFCSACGSPVFSIAAVAPELALIKVGTLDDASWVEPGIEAWTSSAQPWSPHFEHAARIERGPGQGLAGQAMSRGNVEVLHAFVAAYNARDIDAVTGLCTADVTVSPDVSVFPEAAFLIRPHRNGGSA